MLLSFCDQYHLPRCVLPEEQRSTEEESPLNVLVSSQDLERLPEPEATIGHLTLDVLIDCVNFLFDIDVTLREISDPAQVLDSQLASAFGHQPSR